MKNDLDLVEKTEKKSISYPNLTFLLAVEVVNCHPVGCWFEIENDENSQETSFQDLTYIDGEWIATASDHCAGLLYKSTEKYDCDKLLEECYNLFDAELKKIKKA